MIILLILWVLYSISEAYEDSQYEVIYDHKPTLWPRLATGALVYFTWQGLTGYPWLSLKMLSFPLVLASVFWFVFELSGNLFRGNYFFYIGTTATLDKKLKKYEFPVFWVRLWLVGFFLALYYYYEILATI